MNRFGFGAAAHFALCKLEHQNLIGYFAGRNHLLGFPSNLRLALRSVNNVRLVLKQMPCRAAG